MMTRLVVLNTYLLGMAAWLLGVAGCATSSTTDFESHEDQPDKQLTSLRLHLEATPDPPVRTFDVPVWRARPMLVTIESAPFLSEAEVIGADLVDEPGGFSIRVEFDRHGRWILERTTSGNLRRRIAVYSQFGPERWLAAPVIDHAMDDGKFSFTPDATRDEALRIVRGLKNIAKKFEHDPRF
jgi:hypothetical protein